MITPFVHENLRIDFATGFVYLDGEPVRLTMKEYQFLCHLANNAGKLMGTRELIYALNQTDGDLLYWDKQSCYQLFHRLKRKLEGCGRPKHFMSVVGNNGGYRLL